MVNVSAMAVAQGAQQLESEPPLLYVFKKRSGAEAIVEGVVEELSDQVTVSLCLYCSLVAQGVGDIGKSFAFACQSSVS